MINENFYYDEQTATYKSIKPSRRKKVIKSSIFALTIGGLVLGSYALFSNTNKLATSEVSNNFIAKVSSSKASSSDYRKMEAQYKALNDKLKKAESILHDIQDRDDNLYRSYFELSPISDEVRKGGFGGADRYKDLKTLTEADLVIETSKRVDQFSKQLLVQSKSLEEIAKRAKEKEVMLSSIPAIQPIAEKDLKRIASGYGRRLHPILKVGKMHWGLDFAAPTGTPIYATGNGTISRASRMGGYGNAVIIDHGYGYQTYYCHMSRFGNVTEGKKVKRGDIIGYVGSTGLSSGPHLHYEVHKNEEKIDPIAFFYKNISPDTYKKLYDQAQEEGLSMD